MACCRLIVCEKMSHWAAALRSELSSRPPRIVETRSLAGTITELTESLASLVVMETTEANAEVVVQFLQEVDLQFPQARVVVALVNKSAAMGPLMREAGAIDVFTSVREIERLARLARRQFALAPAESLSFRELARERMPWKAFAAGEP